MDNLIFWFAVWLVFVVFFGLHADVSASARSDD